MLKKVKVAAPPAAVPLPVFHNSDEFEALSDADKERVWESYNREIPDSELRPLTAAQRALWNRAKRKVGRARKGKGVKTISVSVERGLLKRAEAHAKKLGVSRAALVGIGLEKVLAEDK